MITWGAKREKHPTLHFGSGHVSWFWDGAQPQAPCWQHRLCFGFFLFPSCDCNKQTNKPKNSYARTLVDIFRIIVKVSSKLHGYLIPAPYSWLFQIVSRQLSLPLSHILLPPYFIRWWWADVPHDHYGLRKSHLQRGSNVPLPGLPPGFCFTSKWRREWVWVFHGLKLRAVEEHSRLFRHL